MKKPTNVPPPRPLFHPPHLRFRSCLIGLLRWFPHDCERMSELRPDAGVEVHLPAAERYLGTPAVQLCGHGSHCQVSAVRGQLPMAQGACSAWVRRLVRQTLVALQRDGRVTGQCKDSGFKPITATRKQGRYFSFNSKQL